MPQKKSGPVAQKPGRRWQFSVRLMLLMMLMTSILAAISAGLLARGDEPNGAYALLAVGAPIGLLICFNLIQATVGFFSRIAAKRRPADLDDAGS